MSYKKTFLENVIARIDFASPVEALNARVPKRFDEYALAIFPIKAPRKEIRVSEALLSKAGIQSTSEKLYGQWEYSDRKNENKMELVQTHMDLVFTKYRDYKDLKEVFTGLTEVLTAEVRDIVIKRFGLRFINNIVLNDKDTTAKWDKYLSKFLLSFLKIPEKSDELLRGFHILDIRRADFTLDFKYGLFNPDFPAPIKKRQFILDYDAFYNGLLDPKNIPSYLDAFHRAIYDLFEKCITNDLRKIMKGSDEKKS